MNEDKPLSKLSNAEFIDLLRSGESNLSWTVGQLSEYENRGSDFLHNDVDLRDKIDTFLEGYYERVRALFEPHRESLAKLSLDISKSFVIPKIEFPKIEISGLLENHPNLERQPWNSPAVQAVEKSEVESIVGYIQNIDKNTKWGSGQWALLVFTIWAALASTWAAIK
jgi:hypothetical protein